MDNFPVLNNCQMAAVLVKKKEAKVIQPWASRSATGGPRIGPLLASSYVLNTVGQPIGPNHTGPFFWAMPIDD